MNGIHPIIIQIIKVKIIKINPLKIIIISTKTNPPRQL
jgi:hypothetical protein